MDDIKQYTKVAIDNIPIVLPYFVSALIGKYYFRSHFKGIVFGVGFFIGTGNYYEVYNNYEITLKRIQDIILFKNKKVVSEKSAVVDDEKI